jgi:hypothetical protein
MALETEIWWLGAAALMIFHTYANRIAQCALEEWNAKYILNMG